MEKKELLEEIRNHYKEAKFSFAQDQEEMKFLCLRDYRQGRLQGMFTRSYWKRKDLFLQGQITYGYVFKDYHPQASNLCADYPIWLILSPSIKFADNPDNYLEIIERLNEFMLQKPRNKKEKKLQIILNGELSEVSYLILPNDLTNGELVYLCSSYVRYSHTPTFHLGLNLVIYAPTISKEVMLLPYKFWTEEWKAYYLDENK